jgi:hypothetical protein
MPYRVEKNGAGFKLYNTNTQSYAKKTFKSKETAVNFAKNAIRFSEKKDSKVEGNVISAVGESSMKKKPKASQPKKPRKVQGNFSSSKSNLSGDKIKCC